MSICRVSPFFKFQICPSKYNNKFIFDQALADLVIPLEYGISKEEKLDIGQGILTPLLRKIRMDFQRVIENDFDLDDCSRLDPR